MIWKSFLIVCLFVSSVGLISANSYASDSFTIDEDFDFSSSDVIGVWSDKNPRQTENVSPSGPLNPGERLEIGVAYSDDDNNVEFGEELEFYSTDDGENYERLTNHKFLNEHLEYSNGRYEFVVPSVEIGGTEGLQKDDRIEVKNKPVKTKSKGDDVDATSLAKDDGLVNLRKAVENGEDIKESVEIDRLEPVMPDISKVNATTVKINIKDSGPAPLDNNTFINSSGQVTDDLFSYSAISSRIGLDEPEATFEYKEEKSSDSSAVFHLKLDKKFERSKGLEVFLDGTIKDSVGNEINSLGSQKTVYDMNEQPPKLKTNINLGESTLGGSFNLTVYARSANDITEISADVSKVNSKDTVTKTSNLNFNGCGDSEWNNCYSLKEENIEIEEGSDGINKIPIEVKTEEGYRNTTEEQINLSITSQIADSIKLYDTNNNGSIENANVTFEQALDSSSINKDHWKMKFSGKEIVSTNASLADDKVLELEFSGGVNTTDATKVDVVHASNTDDTSFLKTENGARVPSISEGRIIETDKASPAPVNYQLQKNYDKGLLTFSEEIESAQNSGNANNVSSVYSIPNSDKAVVNFSTGVSSPDSGANSFSAEDGETSGESVSIDRSEYSSNGGFVALNEGWNVVALPRPGSVTGIADGENLNSLSCVEQSYTRIGSWSNDVEDLSHQKGTYLKASQPCVLEFKDSGSEFEDPSINFIDDSDLEEGWNLISPYRSELISSGDFGWIDYGETGVSDIFSLDENIEDDLSCSDDKIDCSDVAGEDDVNIYDAYWAEN